MAAGVAAAAGSALAGLGQAFSQQSRQQAGQLAGQLAPRQDTSTPALALVADPRARKTAAKNARDERILALVTDPQVMGLLVVFGGLWAAQAIPWSQDPGRRQALAALASSSAVLMGLGRAGVGDLTSLAVAAGAAGAVVGTGSGLADFTGTSGEVGSDRWPATLYLGGLPLASAFGPLPLLQRLFG